MKDLQSQLSAAFGVPVPPKEDPDAALQRAEPAGPEDAAILKDGAWRGTEWERQLRTLLRGWTGSPKLADRPSFGQQRQVTDQLLKHLKKAGQRRQAKELQAQRDAFVSKRDKAAWTAIKARFGRLELSDKAYRRLKQGSQDPLRILERLQQLDESAVKGMGAKRLVDALTR